MVPAELQHGPYGELVPAYNRGALVDGKVGRIFWIVAAKDRIKPDKSILLKCRYH